MTLHIYAPSGFTWRAIRRCTTCRTRRRFLVTSYVWYSAIWECGGCGHRFGEEGRMHTTDRQRALRRAAFHERWVGAGTWAACRDWCWEQVKGETA